MGGSQEDLGEVRLPIFIRIADYAERLEDQPDLSLLAYFQQFYHQWEVAFETTEIATVRATLPELLLGQMRQGNCLILLDGLDEVFDQDSRRRVVQSLDAFVEEFSSPEMGRDAGNKFVITSRIAGYRDVQLSARFQEFTIAEMAEAQVAQFLQRWCRAIEEAQQPEASEAQWVRQAEAEAGAILKAIGRSEGVKRLTVNPLLLTILALIHRNVAHLPERRVDLYKLAVKTLTEDWQLGKRLPDAPKLVVKEHEAMELLAPLAYWMHEEKPSGVVTHAEVIQQLSPKLAELRGESPDALAVQQAVESFLRRVRETTGLFVERAPSVYGFMHLTFEEYFAARYIADNELRDMLALIQEHWHEPRWEEPILLALGYLGSHSPNQLNRLVEQLFTDLDQYQPIVSQGDIRIKYRSAQNNILVFPVWNGESEVRYKESGSTLQPLLLAGKVLSQVELNSKIRIKLIEKLILTYIGLPELCFNDVEHKIEGQLLILLRQIESFQQAEEVRDYFAKLNSDLSIPAWKRMKIQLAKLHLACDMRGQELVNYVTELISQLDPFWFGFFMRACEDGNWGTEMSQALELIQYKDKNIEQSNSISLDLIKALSYLREKHIDRAITLLEDLCKQEHRLAALTTWAQAVCYRGKGDEPRAIKYYKKSFEQLKSYPDQNALCCFWQWWATSYRSIGKYEEALKCVQHGLSHARNMGWENGYLFLKEEIAKIYSDLKDYEFASENFQTVHNLYGEIGCDLLIAGSESNLGKALQSQGKYEEAITHFQQSRDRYQQLDKEKDV
ncbi:MAG: tetratricopeptide repeat protein, partial [Cyanobacteria bacterium CRU_2_1]|nr:tetratricopeptide repeat protein [Cyanobacteria bacterium CRU_2_1]